MRRSTFTALFLAYCLTLALGLYEMTAKAPGAWGGRLPGRQASVRAERMTAWHRHTGILVVDRLIHESEEALRFYTYLLDGPQIQTATLVLNPDLGG